VWTSHFDQKMAFLKLFSASSFLTGPSCLDQEGKRTSRVHWLGSWRREDKPDQAVHWSRKHGPGLFFRVGPASRVLQGTCDGSPSHNRAAKHKASAQDDGKESVATGVPETVEEGEEEAGDGLEA
jgi:hypothetical protein